MLPAQKMAEEERQWQIADNKTARAEEVEAQAKILKGMFLKDGYANIGKHGVTWNYPVRQAFEEYHEQGLYKALESLHENRNSDLGRHQSLNKLLACLDSILDEASKEHAKMLLEETP